jgi:hypothetical protein
MCLSYLYSHTIFLSHKHVPGLGNIYSAFRDILEFHQRQILRQDYVWHEFYERFKFP